MNEDIYKAIFSENLKYYMELNDKSQQDLVRDLGLNKSAVSTWFNGTRLPRMDKVNLLAKYFHISRSDLIEPLVKDNTPAAPSELSEEGYLIGKAFDSADETDKNSVRRILRIEDKEKGSISSVG